MGKYLLQMPDNKYLCFNHSIIAVAYGIELEIVNIQGHWGVSCDWCSNGLPEFGPEPINEMKQSLYRIK